MGEPTWHLEPGTDHMDPGVIGTLILLVAGFVAAIALSVHAAHKPPDPVVTCNAAIVKCPGHQK